MQAGLQDELSQRFSDALVRVNRFELNSIPQALIEARFCGDDPRVLDSLTQAAIDVMRRNPKVMNARNEWGNKAMMLRAAYDPVKAGRLGLGKADLMTAVKSTGDGTAVGIYRDGDKQVPYCCARRVATTCHKTAWATWLYGTDATLPRWHS